MNNVLIYFCANVQILIRRGTIVFTKSDLTPGEKHRISPRSDHAPGVSPVFLQDSTTHPAQGLIFLQDSTTHPAQGLIFLQDSTAHPTRAPYFSKIRNCQLPKFFFSSIMYSGRALISSKRIPTYCPNTPTVNNCTPPKKIMEVMIEVQPTSALLKP